MNLSESIKSKVKITEEGPILIKRTEEELAEIKEMDVDIYESEIEVDSDGYDMSEPEDLGSLLSKKNSSEFSDRSNILTDFVKIGDAIHNVALIKANNHLTNHVKEGKLMVASCPMSISKNKSKSFDLSFSSVKQVTPMLSQSESTKIDGGVLTQVQAEGRQKISVVLANKEFHQKEAFNNLVSATINLKARMMIETMSGCTPDDLRSQLFITNNRRIREAVEDMIKGSLGEIDDLSMRERVNEIMNSLNVTLGIKSIGDAKMSLGIQLIELSRSKDFNWEIMRGDRNYKQAGDFYQRSLFLNDTYSTIPVKGDKIQTYLKDYKSITNQFVQWANNEVLINIGEKPRSLPKLSFKEVNDQKVYEIIGLTKDEAEKISDSLQKDIVSKVQESIKNRIISSNS